MTIQELKKVDIEKVSNLKVKKAILDILEYEGYKSGDLDDEDMNSIFSDSLKIIFQKLEQEKAQNKSEKSESKPKEAEKKPEKEQSKPKDAEKKPEKEQSKPKDAEKKPEKEQSKPKEVEKDNEKSDEILGCEQIIKEHRLKVKENKIKKLVLKAKEMKITPEKIEEAKENINDLRVLVGEIEKPSKKSKTETGVRYIINENAGVSLSNIKADKKEAVEKIKEIYTQKIAQSAKEMIEEMKKEINKLLAA